MMSVWHIACLVVTDPGKETTLSGPGDQKHARGQFVLLWKQRQTFIKCVKLANNDRTVLCSTVQWMDNVASSCSMAGQCWTKMLDKFDMKKLAYGQFQNFWALIHWPVRWPVQRPSLSSNPSGQASLLFMSPIK